MSGIGREYPASSNIDVTIKKSRALVHTDERGVRVAEEVRLECASRAGQVRAACFSEEETRTKNFAVNASPPRSTETFHVRQYFPIRHVCGLIILLSGLKTASHGGRESCGEAR